MKKIYRLLAVLVIGLMIIGECNVVQAAEIGKATEEATVTSRGLEIRELSLAEKEALLREIQITSTEDGGDSLATVNSSYTAYEYSEIFDISIGGTWVAAINAVCTVWHYTDGKVHLYNRTITVTRLATYDATRTYGRIVNTDGSLSYTTGDRVTIIDYVGYWTFAIDFRVTPTEASFNCYEV